MRKELADGGFDPFRPQPFMQYVSLVAFGAAGRYVAREPADMADQLVMVGMECQGHKAARAARAPAALSAEGDSGGTSPIMK